ncbi:hypothetical protein M758_1G320100 [Ceratodon purpureus]|nr:hypothetical protein M758_1G320100 [Ceratodon purpureus]
MAGPSPTRSLSTSLYSSARYISRALQTRIEPSASRLTASSSSAECDHGERDLSSSSPWESAAAAALVSNEDVLRQRCLLQSRTGTGYMLPRMLLLQSRGYFRQYSGIAFENSRCTELAWSRRGFLRPSPSVSPFVSGGIRFKTRYNKAEQAAKRASKKKKAKAVRLKLRQIRLAKKLRKASMTPEQALLWRIGKCKKKIKLHEEQLKKFELPPLPEPDPDPEILTPEQLHALKKLGYKNKNYVPVGRRGIYGGTIQNMHMHWKKHETVRIDCDNFPKEKIKDMGETLERLSGGTVIDIHQATTIIMWRGRNYKRPKVDIPVMFKNFNKRKALLKSKHEQSIGSLNDQIRKWEKELRAVREDMAREAAERARWLEENPGMEHPDPPAPVATDQSDYDSDEVSDLSDDDDITSMEDLGPEYDSDSDYEYPDSDEDLPNGSVSSDHDRKHSDTSSDMDSSDEWERNVYASGDETESDDDTPTRATLGSLNAARRKS